MIKFIPQDKKTDRWLWEWERKAFPSYIWLFLTQWRYCKFSPPVYGCITYKEKLANAYLDVRSLNKAAQAILNKIERSPGFLKRWTKFVYKTGKEVQKFCDKIEKTDLKTTSDFSLSGIYQESIKRYLNHTDGVAVIRNSNRLLQERLTAIYKDSSIVVLLLLTAKKSFILKEHEELLKIAERIRRGWIKKDKLEKDLNRHTKKYFYLPCGYSDEKIFTKSDFNERFNKILKSKENLQDFNKRLRQQNQTRTRLILRLKPQGQIKQLIDFGSTCTYFKDFIRGNLNRLQYINRKIFEEIGNRTGNGWQEIACLIPKEVKSVLKTEKSISKRYFAVLFSDKEGVHLLLDKNAQQKIREVKASITSKTKEIKGTGASPGRIRGRVLLVRKIKDTENKDGFVLVSSMTTPDLIPAVKKAVAIVTDEGGLTCHAAIISREFNIPCIIGTKIATKVLRDGQLVEVDADKGTVMILKQKT